MEWKHAEANQTNDSWVLPNGNVVYAYMYGVRIVTPNFSNPSLDKTVWDRPTKVVGGVQGETHSCQPLDGGSSKFLVGESYDTISFIVEVDTANKEWRRIGLPHFGSGTHNQFRQIRKTPQGTYLVTQQTGGGTAFEFDSTGKQLRQFPDGRYCAIRLSNGNTLIGCGDNGRAIEVDPSNTIVWQMGSTDIPGQTLGFVAGLVRLTNGNTLICNWMGHGVGSGAPVIEVTPGKQLVWSLTQTIATMVSSIQVLSDKDTVRPALVRAYDSAVQDQKVSVVFSKVVDSLNAATISNYTISQGITIASAGLSADGKTVILSLHNALTSGKAYSLSASNVKDKAFPANVMIPVSGMTVEFPAVGIAPRSAHGLSSRENNQIIISIYDTRGRLERTTSVCEEPLTPRTLKSAGLAGGLHILKTHLQTGLLQQTIIIQ